MPSRDMAASHTPGTDATGSLPVAVAALGSVAQPLECIEELAELVQAACGLDLQRAKTLSYYALATHGLPNLLEFPVLAVQGPPGTGKSTILDILEQITYEPYRLDGSMSRAELRDSLKGKPTAIIEEADLVYERLILKRNARRTSKTSVKREVAKGWESEPLDLFGATILHRRPPFKDPALQSRSITVRTRRAEGPFTSKPEDYAPYKDGIAVTAADIPWDQVDTCGGTRALDTWAPLLLAAKFLGDETWLAGVEGEIKQAEADLGAGQEEEPEQLVFLAVLSLAVNFNGLDHKDPAERVAHGEVTNELKRQGRRLTSYQIGQIARSIGFEIKKKGGDSYIYTGGAAKLVAIGAELGIEDEWLAEAAQQ